MATMTIDTHRLITDLKEKYAFSEQQAEGVSEAIAQIDLQHVATKQDIRESDLQNKTDLKELELRLTIKMGSFIGIATALLASLKLFG